MKETQMLNIEPPKWIVKQLTEEADNLNIPRKSYIHILLEQHCKKDKQLNINIQNKK